MEGTNVMMFLIQDEGATKAARMVPDKLKFKQLIELCQLICSAGFSDIFDKLPRGKEIQEWIKRNEEWTFIYGITLYNWCWSNTKMKEATKIKCAKILNSLVSQTSELISIKDVVFRYKKDYKNTSYSTNSLLPVKEGIKEYRRYVDWKVNGEK